MASFGGVAQLARAPALQAGGHRFESDHLHQHIEKYIDKLMKKRGILEERKERKEKRGMKEFAFGKF